MFALAMLPIRLAARALVCASLIGWASAQAQPAQDADALIKQGVELRREGKDQAALEQFRRAFDVAPTPRALAQMALAEQALGRWIDAEAHVGKALEAAQDPWIAKYRDTLEQSRAKIAEHLGTLAVTGGPDGAELRVDGQAVGALPLGHTLRLPTGTVALELTANGRTLVTRTVSIAPGLVTHEDLGAPAATPAGANVSEVGAHGNAGVGNDAGAPTPRSGRRKVAWLATWSAVGLGAVGGVALVVREVEARRYQDENCPLMAGDPSCQDHYSTGTTARNLGIGALIAGGALGATAAVLFLTMPDGGAASDGRVACLPAIDLGHAGAACALRF
jgi:hypothetical protein